MVERIVDILLDAVNPRDIAHAAFPKIIFQPYTPGGNPIPGDWKKVVLETPGKKREYLGLIRTTDLGVRVVALPHIVNIGTSMGDELERKVFPSREAAGEAMRRFLDWYKQRYPRHLG